MKVEVKVEKSRPNYLLIYADKSGSMAGRPIQALNKSLEDMANSLFATNLF